MEPSEIEPIRELVARFVRDELLPLEPAILRREASTGTIDLTADERRRLDARARELGLWALDAPGRFGGQDLPAVAMIRVWEELGQTPVPYHFPPDSPNLRMLDAVGTDAQKERYLKPYAHGDMVSAIAISEPGAGGDVAEMRARAVPDGGDWVLNGRKIWISNAARADFTIVMARVGDGLRHEGVTAFIVDKGTPGYVIERAIPMLGGHTTYEVLLDDLRLPHTAVLGEVGRGFAPMQLRLVTRRLEMGAQALGTGRRALDMLMAHARERVTFGARLADRQAIQWWVADAAIKLHALEMMLADAARKTDAGQDVRHEVAMIKVFATENVYAMVDHAMQTLGGLGMTRELPLHLLSARLRVQRIYEGPTEVHLMAIARKLFRDGR